MVIEKTNDGYEPLCWIHYNLKLVDGLKEDKRNDMKTFYNWYLDITNNHRTYREFRYLYKNLSESDDDIIHYSLHDK